MAQLSQRLRGLGYDVYVVPEIPTMLMYAHRSRRTRVVHVPALSHP